MENTDEKRIDLETDFEIDLETDGNYITGGGKIIGIDLGTTNSCMAVMEGGGMNFSPVDLKSASERFAGEPARRQLPSSR